MQSLLTDASGSTPSLEPVLVTAHGWALPWMVVLVLVVLSLVLQLPFALGLAVLLDQRLRGRAVLRLLFFLPFVLSEVITAVVWRLLLQPDGLVDRTMELLGAGRFGSEYWQDHAPVRDAATVAGHAVRQLYLDCGAVDVAVELGDDDLLASVQRRWAARRSLPPGEPCPTNRVRSSGSSASRRSRVASSPASAPSATHLVRRGALIREQRAQLSPCRTDRTLPAGSLNQAMSGPSPRAIPRSSRSRSS